MPRFRPFLFPLILVLLIAGCDTTSSDRPDEIGDGIVDLMEPWKTASPGDIGLSSSVLSAAAAKAARNLRFRSLLVVKDGRLVFERYFNGSTESELTDVRSVTKSVVSTLVGIALDKGHITDLDESIGNALASRVEILPEYVDNITIRDLLTMSGGWAWDEGAGNSYTEWIGSENHIQYVLDLPRLPSPGFLYNSGAVHLLGVVLEVMTGKDLEDYADLFLFDKIGIQRKTWESLENGYVNGGAGIDLRPRDLARIGQLFIQNGFSGREQVLSESWITEATSPKFDWRSSFGTVTSMSYGYLWWTNEGGSTPAFFAWGWGGQFIYVVPDRRLVIVTTTRYQGLNAEGGPGQLERLGLEVITDIVDPG
ncbi:MAG: serine hydrolase [Rhodothermia bacterium]|nr:MAG: serine hydrolase [Rhodothermia bacterium]